MLKHILIALFVAAAAVATPVVAASADCGTSAACCPGCPCCPK